MEITERIMKATAFAARAHDGQKRWGGTPYIVHPFRVALRVLVFGEDYVVTALLHDVIEDTDVTLKEVRERFGGTVADAVEAITKYDGEGYGDYIVRCSKNKIARTVKLADLSDNTRSSDGQSKSRKKRYDDALDVLSAAGEG